MLRIIYIGKLALCTVHVEDVKNLRKVPKSVTRRTSLRHQKERSPWCQTWSFRTYYKAKEVLQKARQPKHGGYRTILERWHKDDKYRKSLSVVGWIEEQIIQYDELALEDHSYFATREERTRNENSRVLKLNKEGVQGQMNQGPDFVEAKREMKRLHDEHVKETSEGNTPIHLGQRPKQLRNQQFEGPEVYDCQIDAQTGWRTYPSQSQGNLSRNPTHSSSSTQLKTAASNIFVFIKSMGTARRLEVEQWNSWRSSS